MARQTDWTGRKTEARGRRISWPGLRIRSPHLARSGAANKVSVGACANDRLIWSELAN